MTTIVRHLICKIDKKNITQSRNLHKDDNEKGIFFSGNWTIKLEEAKALIGGKLFLHREKDQKSFFGGDVIDVSSILVDDNEKVILNLKLLKRQKMEELGKDNTNLFLFAWIAATLRWMSN